jgi:NMD protein affecting ribosome stability and mRNA decay
MEGELMATVSHKRGVEEKGQRANRSSDVYKPKMGAKEPALCSQCGALYKNKRWSVDEAELKKAGKEVGLSRITCPACRRMADNNPAGIVTFSGKYLLEHKDDILKAIRNVESRSRVKNPLGRIMNIVADKGTLTVATTEDKLAQKIGREIFKAHHGELNYRWNHEERFVRVDWSR